MLALPFPHCIVVGMIHADHAGTKRYIRSAVGLLARLHAYLPKDSVFTCEDYISHHCHLAATPQCIPIDRRNDRLANEGRLIPALEQPLPDGLHST